MKDNEGSRYGMNMKFMKNKLFFFKQWNKGTETSITNFSFKAFTKMIMTTKI